MLCGRIFSVDVPHVRNVVPVEARVAAYPAVLDFSKGRSERYTASEYLLVAAEFPQEVHRAAHASSAALAVEFSSGSRPWSCSVQEVQFYQIKSPVIEHRIESALQVIADARMIKIQSEESAPVASRVPRLSVMSEKPVRVVLHQLGLALG